MDASRQAGTLIAHRYRILTRIGEGGFGTVYKACDQQQHGKIVAVKEINMVALSAQEKIEVTDTFNREITLLSDLKHKNLPRIFNQFTDPEHWYIVMDYIEGQTLEELLTRSPKGRLSVSEVIKIGMALCDVLSYLHDQKPSIIFRDVKPGNIMYTPSSFLWCGSKRDGRSPICVQTMKNPISFLQLHLWHHVNRETREHFVSHVNLLYRA
jgi:serine/threonine protein kinase